MASEFVRTQLVGLLQRCIDARRFRFEPGKQSRAEIKAHHSVVVNQLDDALFIVENARGSIGRIAFRGDPFVPVMVWISGILQLNRFERRILSGRLIEMTVNTNVSHDYSVIEFTRSNTTNDCADSVRGSAAFISLAKKFPGQRHFLSAEFIRTDQRPAGKCRSSMVCSLFPNS